MVEEVVEEVLVEVRVEMKGQSRLYRSRNILLRILPTPLMTPLLSSTRMCVVNRPAHVRIWKILVARLVAVVVLLM